MGGCFLISRDLFPHRSFHFGFDDISQMEPPIRPKPFAAPSRPRFSKRIPHQTGGLPLTFSPRGGSDIKHLRLEGQRRGNDPPCFLAFFYPPDVHRLAMVAERGIAGDHEHARQLGQGLWCALERLYALAGWRRCPNFKLRGELRQRRIT